MYISCDLPGARDSFIIIGTINGQHGHTRTNIDQYKRIWAGEIINSLFTIPVNIISMIYDPISKVIHLSILRNITSILIIVAF